MSTRVKNFLNLSSYLLVAILCTLPCLGSDLASPSGRISGVVVDGGSKEGLPGANLLIKGTVIGTVSNLDGKFVLPSVPEGPQVLVASYLGFTSKEIQLEIQEGQEVSLTIELFYETLEGEEVLITAQVEGQIAAINQQLASNTITNVVSADRIQELPDVNAAESIGRLPGVSIQRSGGEANKIAIRGLSPKYNTVTVNGVRVPSTGADDRSVDLSLISSNMLDGIEVMKAITADKDADAIGGAIDLKLKEAPERVSADFLLQGGYNQLQDYYGNYKFSGSSSSRFWDSKLGVILSVSLDEFDRTSDQFSGNYRQEGSGESARALIQSINLRESDQIRSRKGGSFVADARIPFGKVIVNGFFNELSGTQNLRANNFDLEGQRHLYSLSENEGTTSIATFAGSVEQVFNRFSYDAGVSSTSSRRKSPLNYFWQFMEEGAYDTEVLGDTPSPADIPLAFFNDLSNTDFLGFSTRSIRGEEDEKMFQLNGKMPFQIGSNIAAYVKTGMKYRTLDRFNDENAQGRQLYYGGDQQLRDVLADQIPEIGIVTGDSRVPLEPFLDDYTRSNFLDGDYPLGYTIDSGLAKQVTNALEEFWLEIQGESRRRDYSGKEKYRAAYAMAEFNYSNWLTFIPGLRWEDETSTYQGQFVREVGQNQTPVAIDTTNVRSNSFFLPMIHLQLKPSDWLSIRMAYTKTLTRPDFLQYAPVTFVNQFGTFVNAGNPNLSPAKSTNLDLSLSVYQNKVGLLTVSLFKKQIDDLIVRAQFPLLDGQEILPDLVIPALSGVPSVATSVNNPFQADLSGFEVDWQTNFWYLPSFFKGVVLGLNYTGISSELEVPRFLLEREPIPQPPFFINTVKDTSRVGRLPDQPQHIANVTLGYDYKEFSARISMLYQTNVTSFFGNTFIDDRFTDDYVRWDISVKQNLPANAQLFANFNNINARPDRDFRAELGATPSFIEYYGFTMDVGVRFRY